MGHPNGNRALVQDLVRQGKTIDDIREVTGLSKVTIYNYRNEMADYERPEVNSEAKADEEFAWKWAVTVNRLRRAMRKRALRVPFWERADEERWWKSRGIKM